MKPYYAANGVQLFHGDCRAILPTLADGSVNCVVTSPPYWGLRDYGTATWEGGDAACDHVNRHGLQGATGERANRTFTGSQNYYRDKCKKCGAARIDVQIGLEKSPQEYVAEMVAVFREVRRILSKDGTMWLNLGDSYSSGNRNGHGSIVGCKQASNPASRNVRRPMMVDGIKDKDLVGIPWRVAFALQADGWYLRQDIIWSKPNPMPESVTDRCTKAHEYLFLLAKSAKYHYDADAISTSTAQSNIEQLNQNIDNQQGSDRANGGTKTNGPMKAVFGGRKKHSGYGTRIHSGNEDSGSYLAKGVNRRSVWTIATQPYSGAHFAVFPEDLVKPCILAGCKPGGTVLDPFAGSGTTLQVASELGCKSIGIEANADYCELVRKRMENVTPCIFSGATA